MMDKITVLFPAGGTAPLPGSRRAGDKVINPLPERSHWERISARGDITGLEQPSPIRIHRTPLSCRAQNSPAPESAGLPKRVLIYNARIAYGLKTVDRVRCAGSFCGQHNHFAAQRLDMRRNVQAGLHQVIPRQSLPILRQVTPRAGKEIDLLHAVAF